jgi:hypothetical protein
MIILYIASGIIIFWFFLGAIKVVVKVSKQYKLEKWYKKHPGMKEAIDKTLKIR